MCNGKRERDTNETLLVDKEVDDLAVLAGLVVDVLLDVVKEPWLLCPVFRGKSTHEKRKKRRECTTGTNSCRPNMLRRSTHGDTSGMPVPGGSSPAVAPLLVLFPLLPPAAAVAAATALARAVHWARAAWSAARTTVSFWPQMLSQPALSCARVASSLLTKLTVACPSLSLLAWSVCRSTLATSPNTANRSRTSCDDSTRGMLPTSTRFSAAALYVFPALLRFCWASDTVSEGEREDRGMHKRGSTVLLGEGGLDGDGLALEDAAALRERAADGRGAGKLDVADALGAPGALVLDEHGLHDGPRAHRKELAHLVLGRVHRQPVREHHPRLALRLGRLCRRVHRCGRHCWHCWCHCCRRGRCPPRALARAVAPARVVPVVRAVAVPAAVPVPVPVLRAPAPASAPALAAVPAPASLSQCVLHPLCCCC